MLHGGAAIEKYDYRKQYSITHPSDALKMGKPVGLDLSNPPRKVDHFY
jgi:hypothetical protein